MLVCHLATDGDKEDAVLLRIYGALGSGLKIDRDVEIMCLQVAAAVKVGQPVYAIFNNGIVYRFAPGRTLTGEDVTNPDVMRCSITLTFI